MSQITIQCCLIAKESDRPKLWILMAELNKPFINKLLKQVAQHPNFETWQQKGFLKAGTVKQLSDALKADPRYIGQPARFYTSAISLVEYIYKSWLKLQQRLQRKLEGKRRWLEMLKSDEELVQQCNCSLEVIRSQAVELLASLTDNTQNQDTQPNFHEQLFEIDRRTEDILSQNTPLYLLKNRCKILQKEEDPKNLSSVVEK